MSSTSIFKSERFILSTLLAIAIFQYGCSSTEASNTAAAPAPELPVFTVSNTNNTVYQEIPASLEGKVNVEIRPQVEGFLDKIYVEEGAYVHQGQPLFHIDPRVYSQQLQNSNSALAAAKASMIKAKLEMDRLSPLVDAKVISPVQLQTAQQEYANAKALVAQASASVGNANINVGYTTIKAPVSGYIGRIPYKQGSLVSQTITQPLTIVSDVQEMYAYFSLSEPDFIAFKNKYQGNTLEEKVKNVPAVELVMADNSIYPQKGKVSLVEGQFDKTVGAITLRATFPNVGGLLRTGNTAKIRLPETLNGMILVPQESTFEIQDKVFVFAVGDSNKVESRPITISGQTAHYYFVSKGVNSGEKIVYVGTGNLHDGVQIKPLPFASDSLVKARPQ
ncbi:MAG: efflux transporter periplasmic adaptor subunit [Pseudopedobacter saltans]|uniref:Efflux transporter periplasmic adaptor subunit n=1 Tax=Pseudopedobacter saltans TaxID=151895 RepID=A0A2W5F085_9SPHI|nr:MAG: efflux transporter periplasmic adaptor subunit [Pseudopedobacter saltans]